MNDIHEFKRAGLSISQISALTGYSRPTIRKYLASQQFPTYGPRTPRPTKLIAFQEYLEQRLAAGVWNAVVLLRELQEQGYTGGYTAIKDYLRPKRQEARAVAVRRFETPPGHQAQVDWGDLGDITQPDGTRQKLYAFVCTLGNSRAMFCDIATDQQLPTLLRMHEAAFAYLGGLPHEILYDRMKTVVLGTDARGEIQWQATFNDFARYWGFAPRLCRAYRPQTKGKVESGVGYLRKNFLCGREAHSVEDLRQQLRVWLETVANVRVHGTTHQPIRQAWEAERPHLSPTGSRAAYPLVLETVRRASRDAYVRYRSNWYSLPWQQAGQEVIVREQGDKVEIWRDHQRLAVHPRHAGHHQRITTPAHHAGIPVTDRRTGKARLALKAEAPTVEVRPLSVYEAFAQEVAA